MSMAGIKCDDSVGTLFEELKMAKKLRWCTFKISDDFTTIIGDASAPKTEPANQEEEWKVFADTLIAGSEPRYAAYDFQWTAADGHDAEKILFVLWCPDTSKIKQKMLYGSSKDAIKKALIGIGNDLQVRTRRSLHAWRARGGHACGWAWGKTRGGAGARADAGAR